MMRLKASEQIDILVNGYRAILEDDGDFIAEEVNATLGADIFSYDEINDELVISANVDNLPHIRVEYDLNYHGEENHIRKGFFEFIPDGLFPFLYDTIEDAFEAYTGIPKIHMIDVNENEKFFPNGLPWEKK